MCSEQVLYVIFSSASFQWLNSQINVPLDEHILDDTCHMHLGHLESLICYKGGVIVDVSKKQKIQIKKVHMNAKFYNN